MRMESDTNKIIVTDNSEKCNTNTPSDDSISMDVLQKENPCIAGMESSQKNCIENVELKDEVMKEPVSNLFNLTDIGVSTNDERTKDILLQEDYLRENNVRDKVHEKNETMKKESDTKTPNLTNVNSNTHDSKKDVSQEDNIREQQTDEVNTNSQVNGSEENVIYKKVEIEYDNSAANNMKDWIAANNYKDYKGYNLRGQRARKAVKYDESDKYMEEIEELYSYTCPKCNQEFMSKTGLLNHLRKHQTVRNFKCALCHEIVGTNAELIEHKKCHKNEKRSFLCKICQVAFSEYYDYQIHNLKHTKHTQYKCEECDVYVSRKGFPSHISSHYNRELVCDLCNKCFKTNNGFQTHVREHQVNKECGECGRIFRNKTTFDYHMISHTGVKPHQCLYCGKCFSNMGQVRIHTRLHTDERPYQCNICFVKFRQYTDRNRHMVTHKVKKEHECEYCGKKFFHKESIANHVRLHTNFKPFQCPFCKQKFISFQSLKAHTLYKHTDDARFDCQACNVKFKTKQALQRHCQSKAHKNEEYGAELKRNGEIIE